MNTTRRLTLSPDAKVGGVCGGLANFFGIDPTVVRIVFLLLTLFTIGIPGVFIYLILWVVMPKP